MKDRDAGRGRFYLASLVPLLLFLLGSLFVNQYYVVTEPREIPLRAAALMIPLGIAEIVTSVAIFRKIRAAQGALRGELFAVLGTPCGIYTLFSVLLGMFAGSG